jgi:hypothetical protein
VSRAKWIPRKANVCSYHSSDTGFNLYDVLGIYGDSYLCIPTTPSPNTRERFHAFTHDDVSCSNGSSNSNSEPIHSGNYLCIYYWEWESEKIAVYVSIKGVMFNMSAYIAQMMFYRR